SSRACPDGNGAACCPLRHAPGGAARGAVGKAKTMLRYGLPALVIGALCIACAGDARAAVSRDQPDNAGIEPLRREVQAHSTWIGGYAVQCAAILAATGWQT